MSFHDASVSVLMDRMSDIEKQRRLLSMRQKELEAKVAFATTEKADLEREAKAMDEEEVQLKSDLEALAAEEQRLEVQTMEVTDHLRRTEEEEAVHTAAANAELEALGKGKASWQEKADELEALRRTWENDPATSSCLADLRDEIGLLATLKTGKAALEQQKTKMNLAIEKMRAEQQTRLASASAFEDSSAAAAKAVELLASKTSNTNGSDLSSTEAASSSSAAAHAGANGGTPLQSVEEEIQKAEYEWAQITARHTWTVSSLQREVDALRFRAAELRTLLVGVETTRQDVLQRTALLRQCLVTGRCLRCSR